MNSTRQAIGDAAEKGAIGIESWKVNDLEQNEGYNALQLRALSEHFHDPDFWKALAIARKWEDPNAWRFHWHRFIDHLADGKDAESTASKSYGSLPDAYRHPSAKTLLSAKTLILLVGAPGLEPGTR